MDKSGKMVSMRGGGEEKRRKRRKREKLQAWREDGRGKGIEREKSKQKSSSQEMGEHVCMWVGCLCRRVRKGRTRKMKKTQKWKHVRKKKSKRRR